MLDSLLNSEPERFQGARARVRLDELRIPEGVLIESLRSGDMGARTVTVDHPVSAAGLRRWIDTAGALRRQLVDLGWQANDEHGVARSIAPDLSIAVIAAAGNSATGNLGDADLQFKRAKGKGTAKVVLYSQLELELDITPAVTPDSGQGRTRTWFLLYRCDPETGDLYGELSLPNRIGEDGLVGRWDERIVLSSIPSATPLDIPRDAGADDGVEFDVEAL